MNNVFQLKRYIAKRERALREQEQAGNATVGSPVWMRAPSTIAALVVVLGGFLLGVAAVVYAVAHLIAMAMP